MTEPHDTCTGNLCCPTPSTANKQRGIIPVRVPGGPRPALRSRCEEDLRQRPAVVEAIEHLLAREARRRRQRQAAYHACIGIVAGALSWRLPRPPPVAAGAVQLGLLRTQGRRRRRCVAADVAARQAGTYVQAGIARRHDADALRPAAARVRSDAHDALCVGSARFSGDPAASAPPRNELVQRRAPWPALRR
eukprot:366399-Chlamydomonas_euryale.AAC.35